jgi:hypothetical protein
MVAVKICEGLLVDCIMNESDSSSPLDPRLLLHIICIVRRYISKACGILGSSGIL